MPFDLFSDQEADVHALRVLLRSNRTVLYQLPTGGGKTVCAGFIMQRLRENGFKTLVLVHRKELVKQFVKTLFDAGLMDSVGVIHPSYTPTPWAPIQVASVFTLVRRKTAFQPDLIIVDEAHHARAKSWETVLQRWPNAKVIGLTATPERTDGKGLGEHFEVMHSGLSVRKLIETRRLSPYRMHRVPAGFHMKGVRTLAGEFNKKDLAERATPSVVANVVNAYRKYTPGRRAIMFGATKAFCKRTAARFNELGIPAGYVGDDVSDGERDDTMEDFHTGRILALCNVSIVDEGFDCPACEVILDAAPTKSVTRYLQRHGRMLRYEEDKIATALDLVGNCWRHGWPDDDRTWTLEDGEISSSGSDSPPGERFRACDKCLTLFKPPETECPNCGAEYEGKAIEEIDVELIMDDGSRTPPKKKREPKMTPSQRKALLTEVRQLKRAGEGRAAWRLLSEAGLAAGYHPNWAAILADGIGIKVSDRH